MALSFDAILSSPQGPGFLAQITRLYLVVFGRPPDAAGLRSYVSHLAEGTPLPVLAEAFLDSDEFRARVGDGSARAVLLRQAGTGGAGAGTPDAAALGALAAGLVLSPPADWHLAVLPALFPDGLVLRDPAEYRIWLAGRPDAVGAAAAGVSFVMLLAEPDPPGLAETVGCVLALGWPGLEIILCGRRFGAAALALAAEGRVRLVRVPFWLGPVAWPGHALRRCRGVFTALLQPGDRLDVRAAPAVAAALQRADIVLSDEDALDTAGLRHSPRLGAAWDPDRALATGVPGVLLARTSLLRLAWPMARGGGAPGLLLAAAALTRAERIVHVPALWLSRTAPAGPAPAAAAIAFLAATGEPGCTVSSEQGRLRVHHPLPEPPPGASIIIATRNRAGLLERCMDGLLNRTDYPALEVIIVDNGSDEPDALALLERLGREARVRVVRQPGPFNWAALNNAGVAQMTGQVAVLLNNDTEVLDPGWLREMVAQAMRPGVGAVGAKLLYPDRTIQHAGVVLDTRGHALHMWRRRGAAEPGHDDTLVVTREVTAVTGACLAIRREVYEAIGGCDAENLPVTWNDVDLCLRVREHGLRVIWTPHACLLHMEQASRGSDDTPENDARFRREQAWMRRRWQGALTADPFLNPNLLYSETEVRLAVDWPEI